MAALEKVPEAEKNPEQVAPQAAEAATIPMPVAPKKKRKKNQAVVEVDLSARSMRAQLT